MILTRRSLMQLAGAGFAPWSVVRGLAASDFWNTKNPDNWTADEIARLLRKSPWAKEITGERTGSKKNPSTDLNGPYPRTRNQDPLGRKTAANRPPKQSAPKTVTTYKGTVVWESAKVIRDGSHSPLPDGFAGQYVLSVAGVALTKSSSKNALNNLRQTTLLHAKGRDPLEATSVQENQGNGSVYYVGFSREALAITKEEKEVVFSTHLGKVEFTARFNPREMLYHGELAV